VNGADAGALAEVARRLLGRAPQRLRPLPGGGNNRVFRAELEAGPVLVKAYYRSEDDARDRLGAEFGVLSHLWRHGVRCIPEPLAADPASQVGIYGFVEGTPLAAADVRGEDVLALAELLGAMWRLRDAAGAETLGPASEATFSSADLVDLIERRRARLLDALGAEPAARQARRFLESDFAAAFEAGRQRALAGCDAHRLLPPDERTLSPSDHGFHNAIRARDGGLVFVDFEYAGWDDPAKMLADGCLQPEVPLPPLQRGPFLRRCLELLGPPRALARRLRLLYPLWALKWCLILLNEFVPSARARRHFAGRRPHGSPLAQLEKARGLLDALGPQLEDPGFLPDPGETAAA
jgi:hypothetical protein